MSKSKTGAVLSGLLLLAACGSESDRSAPNKADNAAAAAAAPSSRSVSETELKTAVLENLRARHGLQCGTIDLPDTAIKTVELTGGGNPELAVSLNKMNCGAGQNNFSGSPGGVMQFWTRDYGGANMLLEQQMYGFTPGERELVTMQHGGECPPTPQTDSCRVTYRWNEEAKILAEAERILESKLPERQRMAYDYDLRDRAEQRKAYLDSMPKERRTVPAP
ncbi:MAG TPA: hypothetical protein VGD10_10550 [Allosphingosinicella sp.]|uniref:hypothetical protein n=1 Tax=Allosphingosinicella sp. TaxID=2823234 RepID=UPI002ED834E1